jgi:hypothetical protein
MRIVHYLNKFFGGKGGEETADLAPHRPEGAVGPGKLLVQVMGEIWPQMQAKAQKRTRPLPPAVAYAQGHFAHIWSVDGSVLDNILKKCGLLEDKANAVLGGKITTIIDILTQVPAHIW